MSRSRDITKSGQNPWVRAAVIGLIGVLAFLVWNPFLRLENQVHDWNLQVLASHTLPDPDIVVLDIDEYSLEAMVPEYGRYPWSRAAFASLVSALEKQKPTAIVFDILFIDPHREHQEDDLYFINTIRKTTNTYFPMLRLDAGEQETIDGFPLKVLKNVVRTDEAREDARAALLLPMPGIRDTGRIGTINIIPDKDGVMRRYPMYIQVDGWRIPSLPARVAQGLDYPIPDGAMLPLVWHETESGRDRYSFYDVYKDLGARKPELFKNTFTDKVVVIGSTASAMGDLKLTPMGDNFPGVEILATAIDNIKNDRRLYIVPSWAPPIILLSSLLFLAWVFQRWQSALALGLVLFGVSGGLLVTTRLLLTQGMIVFPVVTVILFSWIYYLFEMTRAYLAEQKRRQLVTDTFGRFLDPRVVKQLVDQGELSDIHKGNKQVITVLFSDIQGFTSLSEKKTPQEIVDLLNHYFALQVDVIFRHQGTLDKYIGDAIMAFWGAPTMQSDHAQRALDAARDMELALMDFKKEIGEMGKSFDIGIGIHTGEAVVGFIGSPAHRQDYTVIGDTVNIASRLEGKTRGRCRILISEATRQAVSKDIEFIDHGSVELKGRIEKIQIFEPRWDSK